jgi:hypothetical protein
VDKLPSSTGHLLDNLDRIFAPPGANTGQPAARSTVRTRPPATMMEVPSFCLGHSLSRCRIDVTMRGMWGNTR